MPSGRYGTGRLCPAQARSAPMSGVHKDRDQSGECPQWRAPGCPKRGIPPATYTNEKPLDKYQDARGETHPGPIAPLSVRLWSGHCISRRVSSCHTSTLHRDCMDRPHATAPHSGYFVRLQQPIVSSVGTRGVSQCFQLRSPVGTSYGRYPRSSSAHSQPTRNIPRKVENSKRRRVTFHVQLSCLSRRLQIPSYPNTPYTSAR